MPKVVHLLPVSLETGEDALERIVDGWLLYGPKKRMPHARRLTGHESFETWEWDRDVKAWWIADTHLPTASLAVERAMLPMRLAYCADCAEGKPCAVWSDVALEANGYVPNPETEDAGEAWAGSTTGPSVDWESMFERLEREARRYFRPPGGAATPAAGGLAEVAAAAACLGVAWPGATREQVTAGFRKAILAAHPDRGGSDEAVKRVVAARAVLERAMGVSV